MDNNNIFVPDWNDVVYEGRNNLVFEEKNKEYGAYKLRTRYSRVVIIALLISVSFFLVCLSIPVIMSWLNSMKQQVAVNTEIEVTLSEPPPIDETEPPPPPVTPPPPIQESIKFTPPEVKPDEQVVEPPPTVEDLKESNPGVTTQEGNGATELPSEVTAIEPVEEKPLLFAEQMPEFPGGDEALYRYLNSKLKYTAIAREAGIEGTVFIAYVVDKDGNIANVKCAKDIGGGLGEVAANIVRGLPKYKPAKQNGRPVALQFTIPIKFSLAK